MTCGWTVKEFHGAAVCKVAGRAFVREGRSTARRCAVREFYYSGRWQPFGTSSITGTGSHEVLRGPRNVHDAHAADRERQSWAGGNGIGNCGAWREYDAIDLRMSRD